MSALLPFIKSHRALAGAFADEAADLEKVAGSRSSVILRRMSAAHLAAAASLEDQMKEECSPT